MSDFFFQFYIMTEPRLDSVVRPLRPTEHCCGWHFRTTLSKQRENKQKQKQKQKNTTIIENNKKIIIIIIQQ
jgi:hypothetical protein